MAPSRHRGRRAASLLVVLLAALALALPSTQGVALAGSTLDPAAAAAGWAGRQLKDGERVESPAGADYGLTADVVLGLAATGVGRDAADRATTWLSRNVDAYFRGGSGKDINTGGLAKLALLAQVQHRDPNDFGGQDLLLALHEQMRDDGQFFQLLYGKPAATTFTQSLALLALYRQGRDAVPAKAVDFLVRTRCADGGFPVFYWTEQSECRSDTDGTGIVVQALLAVGRADAAAPALDWLQGRQNAEGGFGGAGPTAQANSNSTALAVQALRAGGRAEAADRGLAWLLGRQVGCSGPAVDRGAVGHQHPVVTGSTLRSTAQVIPALAGKSLAEIDGATGRPDLPTLICPPTSSTTPSPTSPTAPPTTTAGNTPTSSTAPTTAVPAPVAPPVTKIPAAQGNLGGGHKPRPRAARTSTESLARTGADVGDLVVLGTVLVFAGLTLVVLARTRRRAAR
ncbi:prenyltransferase/squalene oxidase repeat-containing protein [Streptoalloteichus hindustanus]|uniref:Prenyltransferase alpha-alpha toroid domain-containing protein n=1 Tax=Streptoalloteichus hindustanus TaxID=2017 RepID=A0A1M5QDE1_STRHI|nr:peptidase [Streptoalloteichus hindustanus]SHH11896.1 hypothetical protein SAMN05444320_12329 [Streptoalloteichus hindustanus]